MCLNVREKEQERANVAKNVLWFFTERCGKHEVWHKQYLDVRVTASVKERSLEHQSDSCRCLHHTYSKAVLKVQWPRSVRSSKGSPSSSSSSATASSSSSPVRMQVSSCTSDLSPLLVMVTFSLLLKSLLFRLCKYKTKGIHYNLLQKVKLGWILAALGCDENSRVAAFRSTVQ